MNFRIGIFLQKVLFGSCELAWKFDGYFSHFSLESKLSNSNNWRWIFGSVIFVNLNAFLFFKSLSICSSRYIIDAWYILKNLSIKMQILFKNSQKIQILYRIELPSLTNPSIHLFMFHFDYIKWLWRNKLILYAVVSRMKNCIIVQTHTSKCYLPLQLFFMWIHIQHVPWDVWKHHEQQLNVYKMGKSK